MLNREKRTIGRRCRIWGAPTAALAALLAFASADAFLPSTGGAANDAKAVEYAVSVEGFHISDITVENLKEPEGIDVAKPRFCWKIVSQDLNETQSAYQLIVSKCFGGDVVWDSGRVESDEQLYVEYGGEPLEPATEYAVELNVWNKDGSKKSQNFTCFSTGLFPTDANPNPWRGKWIGVQSRIPELEPANVKAGSWIAFEDTMSLPCGRSCYRRTFEVADKDAIVAAVANFSADNNAKIYLNGEELGGSDEYKFAATRDLRKALRNGKNVFTVEVGNVGGNPNPGGLVGAFYLTDKEGVKTEYVTDAEWKASADCADAYADPDFDDSSWTNAFPIAKCDDKPWGEVQTAPAERPSPARYLSKAQTLKSDVAVKRAVAFFSGLGYSECYLNGAKLGDQVCGPMYTDYDKRVPYVTYDATDIVAPVAKSGDPLEIGVVLGNGRFYAPRIDKCVHYGEPRLLFQLQIEYADDSVDYIVSDESWKGSENGTISENNDYDGEVCDARNAVLIDPNDDSAKPKDGESRYVESQYGKFVAIPTDQPVDLMDAPKGKLAAQNIQAFRKTQEIEPVSLKEIAPGRWIYDFGQNMVGFARLKVKGPAGTEIKMRFAETLIPDGPNAGELYVANLRTAKCRDIYTVRGDETEEIYEPRFTHHGFRYAELTGFPGTPDLETLTGCVASTSTPQIGFFETSNPTVSQIFHNVVWGTRGNYLHMPTDCPQRDERMGWQGDRAEESKGEAYIFDNTALFEKWLQDIEETQREDGNISDVAPAYWRLYGTNVTWPSAQVIIPDTLRTLRGDSLPISAHFDSRRKWLEHLFSVSNEDGTISRDNYGDWCVPPERQELIHSEDPARQTNRTLLATAYLIYDLKLSVKFAELTGQTDQANAWREKIDALTKVFNETFYDASKGQYDNGTQTSSALPLAFGIVPDGEREKVFATLTNNIENVTDRHIGTGLIGAQWINRVLTDGGRVDLPYTFATNKTFPSWGYMIEKGATTIWELWNGDTADPAMNSGNHVMLVGDLAIWFFEDLAGIKADENAPGFKHIEMKPNVVGDLTYVKASHNSPRGVVASEWNFDPEKKSFVWNVSIPVNSTATVSVPTTNADSLAIRSTRLKIVPPENGEIRPVKYERVFNDFDVNALDKTVSEGRVQFELGSGNYEITAELAR